MTKVMNKEMENHKLATIGSNSKTNNYDNDGFDYWVPGWICLTI